MRTAVAFLITSCAAAHSTVDFSRDIFPIFRAKCHGCHGSAQQMKGLRLDRPAAVGSSVIVRGDSARSSLIARVATSDSGLRMPPGAAPLTEKEISLLRAWIDQGARWAEERETSAVAKKHWSFQPVKAVSPPGVHGAARNPIDQFILRRLEAEGIKPSQEATRATLLRRVNLDLTGLPPSPIDLDLFLADSRPDAYERLVDRLLASPHYGERWARPWLDLARYADSDGYEKDLFRPNAWRWRNWVIDSINAGMSFDQFTIEQIAGDLLPRATVEQRAATGFHRNALKNREAGVNRQEARFEETVDRINTAATTWLGLTAGCAQCHDHKYDPISQREYYQLFAFFDRVEDLDIDAPLPGEVGPHLRALPVYTAKRRDLLESNGVEALQESWEKRLRETVANPGKDLDWDYWLTELRARLDRGDRWIVKGRDQRSSRENEILTDYFITNPGPDNLRDKERAARFERIRDELRRLKAEFPPVTQAPVIEERSDPVTTHVAVKGDYRQQGPVVEPGTLAVLPPLQVSSEPARLRFARWLVSRDNPLTARVVVNRIWQEFFGVGLVRTAEDFGTQGETPSHPELLDWLAGEFMNSGWSLRHIQKLIVTSAVYRQSARSRPDLVSKDPDNRLLARQARMRLSAEQIRDAALSVSRLLYPAVGGRSVRPPQPESVSKVTYSRGASWDESAGPERYRRGLYVQYQRTSPYPQLVTFDAPDSNTACTRRRRSNSPLQALNLLNDPVFFEAAQALAVRVVQEGPPDLRGRLSLLFRLGLNRNPEPAELDSVETFLSRQSDIFQKDGQAAKRVLPIAPKDAALVAAARAMLNLDEFITRE